MYMKITQKVQRTFRHAPLSAFLESSTWRGGGMSQKMVKCEVSVKALMYRSLVHVLGLL